jgi:probable HAF family extracellular repeat protein
VIYSNGTLNQLGTLGGTNSGASGINRWGDLAGGSQTAAQLVHAFFYKNGAMRDVGALNGYQTSASAINHLDQLVGTSWLNAQATTPYHAFLYDARAYGLLDLKSLVTNSSGWVLQEGLSIANAGYITGCGTFNGQQHAFIL